jgi:hypothetical protein
VSTTTLVGKPHVVALLLFTIAWPTVSKQMQAYAEGHLWTALPFGHPPPQLASSRCQWPDIIDEKDARPTSSVRSCMAFSFEQFVGRHRVPHFAAPNE